MNAEGQISNSMNVKWKQRNSPSSKVPLFVDRKQITALLPHACNVPDVSFQDSLPIEAEIWPKWSIANKLTLIVPSALCFPDKSFQKNPSSGSQDTTDKVHDFQAKCPLLTKCYKIYELGGGFA